MSNASSCRDCKHLTDSVSGLPDYVGVRTRGGTMVNVASFFHQSLRSAAKAIGVSETTVKAACRDAGLERWPGRRLAAAARWRKVRIKHPSLHAAMSTTCKAELHIVRAYHTQRASDLPDCQRSLPRAQCSAMRIRVHASFCSALLGVGNAVCIALRPAARLTGHSATHTVAALEVHSIKATSVPPQALCFESLLIAQACAHTYRS